MAKRKAPKKPKAKRKPGGRPSKLTPSRQARICTAIRKHNVLAHAAAAGGIDYSTFQRWILAGEADASGPYREFCAAVKKAQEAFEADQVQVIAKAGKDGSWQASAWLLERRYPDRYGRRDRLDVRAIDREIEIELARLAPGDQAAILIQAGAIAIAGDNPAGEGGPVVSPQADGQAG